MRVDTRRLLVQSVDPCVCQGECLWGRCDVSQDPTSGKQGVWVRPGRKYTRNLDLRITVYAFDGNPTGWHKAIRSSHLEMTHTIEKQFLWVPKNNRWNQGEVRQANIPANTLWENGYQPFQYSDDLRLPKAYQKYDSSTCTNCGRVCTYISETPEHINEQVPREFAVDWQPRRNIDCITNCVANVSTSNYWMANGKRREISMHDQACQVDSECNDLINVGLGSGQVYIGSLLDSANNPLYKLYDSSGNKLYRTKCMPAQTCEATAGGQYSCDRKFSHNNQLMHPGKREARIKTVAVFDVSQYDFSLDNPLNGIFSSPPRTNFYKSGGDGNMMQPESCPYQPAGNNDCAHEHQWYRLEACYSYETRTQATLAPFEQLNAQAAALFKTSTHGGAVWCDYSGAVSKYTKRNATNKYYSGDLLDEDFLLCDNGDSGTSWDPSGFPSSVAALLTNQVPQRTNVSVDMRGGLHYAENYWRFELNTDVNDPQTYVREIQPNTMCVRGLSDFNTEDDWKSKNRDHLDLTLRLSFVDEVESIVTPGVYYTATSASSVSDGHHTVAVESVRQPAVPTRNTQFWEGELQAGSQRAVVDTLQDVQFIEERNEYEFDDLSGGPWGTGCVPLATGGSIVNGVPVCAAAAPGYVSNEFFHHSAHHTWASVYNQSLISNAQSIISPATTGGLSAINDCGGGNRSDVYCLDHLQWKEQSNYHDQHLGRIEIKGYMKKTCDHHDAQGNVVTATSGDGFHKADSAGWEPAGGLFDVLVSYTDEYVKSGQYPPGHSFADPAESWIARDFSYEGTGFLLGHQLDNMPTFASMYLGSSNAAQDPNNNRPAGDFATHFIGKENNRDGTSNNIPHLVGGHDDVEEMEKLFADTNGPLKKAELSWCKLWLDEMRLAEVNNPAAYNKTVRNNARIRIRNSKCVLLLNDNQNLIGHNTRWWSNKNFFRVSEYKCHLNQTASGELSGIACDNNQKGDGLQARTIVSNLRFRLPNKWSNCMTFKFEIKVSNDDRDAPGQQMHMDSGSTTDGPCRNPGNPDYDLATGAWSGTGNACEDYYASSTITVYVTQKKRAEEPRFYFNSNMGDPPMCTGVHDEAIALGGGYAACTPTNLGTVGHSGFAGTYREVDQETDRDGTVGADVQMNVLAGYKTNLGQIRASTGATDYHEETQPAKLLKNFIVESKTTYKGEKSGYLWDSLREKYQPSGEYLVLTIESKYEAMRMHQDTTSPNHDVVDSNWEKNRPRFCLWNCKPGDATCAKHNMVRYRPLPDDVNEPATDMDKSSYLKFDSAYSHDGTTTTGSGPVGNFYNTDFTKHNVNCEPCTPDAGNSATCKAPFTQDAQGKVTGCIDHYQRYDGIGCPQYSESSTYHNPGTRYSIMCNKPGYCDEFANLFIQYPKDQVLDDVLEITLWSRDDWQKSHGFRHSKLNANVFVLPSVAVSEVGWAVNHLGNVNKECDPDSSSSTKCESGMFGLPLQPNTILQRTTSQNMIGSQDNLLITIMENAFAGDVTADGPSKPAGTPHKCNSMEVTSANYDSLSWRTEGSTSKLSTACSLRLPVNFKVEELLLVAPVGVEARVKRHSGFSGPEQIGQGLRFLCSRYNMDSADLKNNAADFAKLQDRFFATTSTGTPAGYDANLMYFQSKDNSNQPTVATGYTLPYTDYAYTPSIESCNKLLWETNEYTYSKELVLVGADGNAHKLSEGSPGDPNYVAGDYSFHNYQCENDRDIVLDLVHQSVFGEQVVDLTRNELTVRIIDDDLYGRFRMGGKNQYGWIVPCDQYARNGDPTAKGCPDNTIQVEKVNWNPNSASVTAEAIAFHVLRERLPEESKTLRHRQIPFIHGARVFFTLDTGSLNTAEWQISVKSIHGGNDLDTGVLNIGTMNADGTMKRPAGPNAITASDMPTHAQEFFIDFVSKNKAGAQKACSPTQHSNPNLPWLDANTNPGVINYGDCEWTDGDENIPVAFDFAKIIFAKNADPEDCGSSGEIDITITISKVTYPTTSSSTLIESEMNENLRNREINTCSDKAPLIGTLAPGDTPVATKQVSPKTPQLRK